MTLGGTASLLPFPLILLNNHIMSITTRGQILALTLAAMTMTAMPSLAERISEKKAAETAVKFLQRNAGRLKKVPKISSRTAVYAPKERGDALFYVFNNDNAEGFTLVSGDDELPAVLGYTSEGEFDYDKLPDGLKYWLGEYEREIRYFYMTGRGARVITSDIKEAIAPKLTTRWNQGVPYNNLCPIVNGDVSVTGCVATAMAQAVNWHEWPAAAEGVFGGIDFSKTPFDYANMLDDYNDGYTEQQGTAVATLMHYLGLAVRMNYSPSASGASDFRVQQALIENFKYNPGIKMRFRDYMPVRDWEELVYNEIRDNGPVIMCGQAIGGGHCFNVDGYQGAGYFHLNWGWGGYQDGYFLLFALNPESGGTGSFDGGYNSRQSIVTEVRPAGVNDTEPQSLFLANDEYRYYYDENEYGHTLTSASGEGIVYNPIGFTQSGIMSVAFAKDDDPETVYYSNGFEAEVEPYYGWRTIPFQVPEIPDGDYRIYPVFSRNGTAGFTRVEYPVGAPQYSVVTVENGNITASRQQPVSENSHLIVTRVEGLETIYSMSPKSFVVTVANVDDADWYGVVTFDIIDSEGKIVSQGQQEACTVPGGYSRDFTLSGRIQIPAGKYTARVRLNRDVAYGPREITVAESLGNEQDSEADIRVDTFLPLYYNGVGSFIGSVTFRNYNRTRSFVFKPQFQLFDSEMNLLTTLEGSNVQLKKNNHVTARYNFTSLELEPGTYYWKILCKDFNSSPLFMFSVTKDGNREGDIVYKVDAAGNALISSPEGAVYAEEVVIPESIGGHPVTVVDGSALTFSDKVNSIVIPATIREIGNGAFFGATSLKSITFRGQTPPALGKEVFSPEGYTSTLINLPAGTANAYKRAEGWNDVHIPSWNVNVAPGLSISGNLDHNPAESRYYVSADEQLSFTVTGFKTDEVSLIYRLSDGTQVVMTSASGEFTLPALGLLDGECTIAEDISGITDAMTDDAPADVYDLSGILVMKGARAADLLTLPKGAYVAGGKKFIRM